MKTHLRTDLLAILCGSMLLQGCADLGAVREFARGAHALSEASGKFYDTSLETDRKLAVLNVDLGAADNSPECRNQDGSYLLPWDCATRGKNLLAETRRNRAAVAALAQYAQSLNDIATFNDDKQVEKAAKELSGNLSDIANTLDLAANTDESALAQAISSVAKIYIDLKARDTVHEKAKQAQDAVATIVKTLQKDIAQQQKRITVARIDAKATREEWFNAFRLDYQNHATTDASKAALSIAAGHLVDDELVDLVAELPSKQFLDNLQRTSESCLQAHIAIQNPDLKDHADTVRNFVNDARSLLSSAKRLTK